MVSMTQRGGRAGQAALEYILVFAALLGVYFAIRVFAIRVFARAARQSATRTTTLVTSEYP